MSSLNSNSDAAGNRRKSPRRRILKAGIVAFNGRHSTLACTIRDISDIGARLVVTGAVNAPDTFELIIELDGLEARCEVVSRKGEEVRVKFLAPPVVVAARRTQVVNAVVPQQVASLRRKPLSTSRS